MTDSTDDQATTSRRLDDAWLRGGSPSEISHCRDGDGKVLERDLCSVYGVSRPELVAIRRTKLVEGEDWEYSSPPPRKVVYTKSGQKKLAAALAVRGEELPEAPAAAAGPNEWLPLESIPRVPANGLILTKGRPGWWTPQEAVVKSNVFANRKAILVTWKGRDVICRVRHAGVFAAGMVIPVRPYENILLAARQPRFPGKW